MNIIDFSKDTEKEISIIKKDPFMGFNVRSLIDRLVRMNNYLKIKINTDKNVNYIPVKKDKCLKSYIYSILFYPLTIDSYYNLKLDKNESDFLSYYYELVYKVYENLF